MTQFPSVKGRGRRVEVLKTAEALLGVAGIFL